MSRQFLASIGASLTVALVAACGGQEAAARRPTLQPVMLPELSRTSESVRQQIAQGHASLTQKIEDPQTASVDLATAHGEMGNLFMAAEYLEPAEACYLNAQALAPQEVRWPYYLGHLYRLKSDSVRSAAAFERVLDLQPNDLAALVYLGDEYLTQGRPEAAEPPLQKALSQEPRLAVAMFGLGRAALARRDYAAAAQHLENALALEPRASVVRYPLAMAYRGLGRQQQAEAHLRERGDVRFAFLPDPLMQQLEMLLASAKAYEYRGSVAFDAGEWAVAASYFRNGLELAPDNASLHMKLAEALRRGGRPDESLAHYEQALGLDPRAPAAARFGYAMALVGVQRYPDARDRLAEGMKLHPDQLSFGRALVRLLAAAPDDRVRDGRRAIPMIQALLKQRQTPDLYETMAMALAEVGQFDAAADLQRQIIAAAQRAGNEEVARRLGDNLRRYEARQPCRTPWTAADMP